MASFPVAHAGPAGVARRTVVLAAALTLCAAGITFSARAQAIQGRGGSPVIAPRTDVVRPFTQLPDQVAGIVAGETQPAAAHGAPAVAEAPELRGDFYLPAVSSSPASVPEQALLRGLNGERARLGLPALTLDDGLVHIARIRVAQLAGEGYFAHVDPAGYTMYTELLALDGRGYAWAGENLAMNTYPAAESPAHAVTALMASPAHRQNILAADFTKVGVGEMTTADGRHLYAMIFLG